LLGLSGAAEGRENRLDHYLAATAQFASDLQMAVRALREGDVSAIAATDPALATFSLDPGGVFFVGQSFGGFTGIATLPALRNVQAAAFFVGRPT
jgi:dienelactone hydrolase